MKKFILTFAIMLASTCAFAQHEAGTITVQPRIGFSAADFNNTSDTKARVGVVVGPEFEYYLTDRFSVAAGLNYSQQGAESDVENFDFTWKNDYLTVPIVANYYIFNWLAVKTGVQPGFKLSSKYEGQVGKTSVSGDDDAVKSFDFSVPIGLSFEYKHFVLDARYTLGVTKIFDEKLVDLDSNNLTFQLTLGYKFNL